MKRCINFFITLYQVFFSPLLHHAGIGGCRYVPSCSEYAKQMIAKHGAIQGVVMGVKRLSTCHPFQRSV